MKQNWIYKENKEKKNLRPHFFVPPPYYNSDVTSCDKWRKKWWINVKVTNMQLQCVIEDSCEKQCGPKFTLINKMG